MLVIIGVAAGAALAVIAYNRVRERDPDLASTHMRRINQLAAVIVVLTSSIERLFAALAQHEARPAPRYGTSYLMDGDWDA